MLHPPRYFVYLDAVARAGSIRKAAENLHVASTALNRKILEVESSLGTPLFERLPRGVRPTAAGEVLLVTVRRCIAELQAAQSRIEQLRGLVRGKVRVGCAESVAAGLLPESIAGFQRSYPGVQFQVNSDVTASLVDALLCDDIELALVHDPAPSALLRVVCGVPQALCAVMRADHPLAGRSGLRLADCQPYPVALGDQSFGSRRLIEECAARSRLELRVTLESNTVQTLKQFTRSTGAISFQFELGIGSPGDCGGLVGVRLTDPSLSHGRLLLITRAGRMQSTAASSFVEMLSCRMTGDDCGLPPAEEDDISLGEDIHDFA